MMVQLYSIIDRAAKAFGAVIQFPNDEMCKRGCEELMRHPNEHPMFRYPHEFDVYRIGAMETDNGELFPITPVMVCRMADFQNGPTLPDQVDNALEGE